MFQARRHPPVYVDITRWQEADRSRGDLKKIQEIATGCKNTARRRISKRPLPFQVQDTPENGKEDKITSVKPHLRHRKLKDLLHKRSLRIALKTRFEALDNDHPRVHDAWTEYKDIYRTTEDETLG